MTERPVIFNRHMVFEILRDMKTATRRLVKSVGADPSFDLLDFGQGMWPFRTDREDVLHRIPLRCPLGTPGERLWVRENWQYADWTEDGSPVIRYADQCKRITSVPDDWSDRVQSDWAKLSEADNVKIDGRAADRRWRPSIHMPRWASRITLEITEVRVERLNDISESDAEAEGIDFLRRVPDVDETQTARELFECLWESIAGSGSWVANPWVWVVNFKRIEP